MYSSGSWPQPQPGRRHPYRARVHHLPAQRLPPACFPAVRRRGAPRSQRQPQRPALIGTKTFASNSSFIETTDADSVNLVDTSGELLEVVEIAKAVDASGALSEARLSSSDSEISLQNSDSADSVELVFIPARDLGQDSAVNYENVIGVPGNYLFGPNHPQKRLHDYCSNSPDDFPNPIGPHSPFHEPCEIDDMCIEAAGHHDHACDGPLRDNMKTTAVRLTAPELPGAPVAPPPMFIMAIIVWSLPLLISTSPLSTGLEMI